MLGVSNSTLSKIESGQMRPSYFVAVDMAQIYRVPLNEVLIKLKPRPPDVGQPQNSLSPFEAYVLEGLRHMPYAERRELIDYLFSRIVASLATPPD